MASGLEQTGKRDFFDRVSTPDLSGVNHDHSHWVNVHIEHEPSRTNINVLELIPIWLCVKRMCDQWRDLHVVCFTDSSSVLAMINKGCSSNDQCMMFLRDIFWHSAIYNFHLTSRHIQGVNNVIADELSRVLPSGDVSIIERFSLCCSKTQRRNGGLEQTGLASAAHDPVGVG